MDEAPLAELLDGCERRRLESGATLLRAGERNTTIYVLLRGGLTVYLGAEADPDRCIAVAVGECIGEFSAIDRQPASALVRCEGEAVVLCLEDGLFWERLVALPGVARNLMRVLSQRARTANRLTLEAQREHLELEHLRKELELARELQAGMLPLRHPIVPQRPELDISARMDPAASVGGDFFDAFPVGDGRLFLCIGDVSGHGIGAALFMARTIGLLRSQVMAAGSAAAVLERLNERLCEANETCLFVTLFCGFLDTGSGHLAYSNAGHCPPLLVRNGQVAELPLPRGPLAGVFPAARFSSMETRLERGDLLFAYTDGITEAEDSQGRPFGIEGCQRLLAALHPGPLQGILASMHRELSSHRRGRGLEDDCTLLLVRQG